MNSRSRLGDADWDVLEVFWERPNALLSAKEVHAWLSPDRAWALSTVRTLLRRLCVKGALSRKREGRRDLYRALLTREKAALEEIAAFRRRVFDREPLAVALSLIRDVCWDADAVERLVAVLGERSDRREGPPH